MLLIKPEDKLTQGLPDVAAARQYFDDLLPMFSPMITDDALQAVLDKPTSRLPQFRYAGPRLHHADNTVMLGDAIHAVTPSTATRCTIGVGLGCELPPPLLLLLALLPPPPLPPPLLLLLWLRRRCSPSTYDNGHGLRRIPTPMNNVLPYRTPHPAATGQALLRSGCQRGLWGRGGARRGAR